MTLGRSLGLMSFLLNLVACAQGSDGTARPKFTPIGSGGYSDQYDSYGGEAGEPWGGNAGGDMGGAAGDTSWDPAPGDPGTARAAGTPNAPAGGGNGHA